MGHAPSSVSKWRSQSGASRSSPSRHCFPPGRKSTAAAPQLAYVWCQLAPAKHRSPCALGEPTSCPGSSTVPENYVAVGSVGWTGPGPMRTSAICPESSVLYPSYLASTTRPAQSGPGGSPEDSAGHTQSRAIAVAEVSRGTSPVVAGYFLVGGWLRRGRRRCCRGGGRCCFGPERVG